MPTAPNQSNTFSTDNERVEGTILHYDTEPLKLDLEDEDVARIIGNRVSTSESFWNKELDLDNVRKENESYYLGRNVNPDDYHDFQVPYNNNRTLVAVESLIPMALSKPAQPLVTPANESDASYELAQNFQDVLLYKAEQEWYLKLKQHMVARHLLAGNRVAYMKYRWNENIGETLDDGEMYGDIEIYVPRPSRVVLSEAANNKDEIPLIAEYMQATVEELGHMFPNKKDALFQELGIARGTNSQLAQMKGYIEIWFSYFDKKGNKKEAVGWKLNNTLLGAIKNPHWNYEETEKGDKGKTQRNNFLPAPVKPYAIFNHLNLGRFLIDDTSLIEQARPMQDIANKRGRQIVENADQANAGTIWNSEMIDESTVAQLIGDPGEKAMVDGDVNKAAARLPQNLLPNYVLQDKNESLSEIDNIFGAHAPIRGEGDVAPTLGQEVLSQRSDISRTQTLALSIEEGMDRLYKGVAQMFKVFYDEPQMIKYTGNDGKSNFVEFSSKAMEDGMKIRVKSGSVLPDDPVAKEAQTLKALPILDPLSIAEGLNKEDPKEFAKRILFYRLFPDRYINEILQEDPAGMQADPSALQEIEFINRGDEVPPQEAPTKMHLATHNQYMNSPQFKELDPQIKQMHVAHVKAEIDNSKRALGQSVDDENEVVGEENTPAALPAEAPNPEPQARGLMSKVRGLFGGGENA